MPKTSFLIIESVFITLQGVIGSGLMAALMTWVARVRGPLFVSSFYPLFLVIVAIAGSVMLDELLHLGRFISILPYLIITYGLFGSYFLRMFLRITLKNTILVLSENLLLYEFSVFVCFSFFENKKMKIKRIFHVFLEWKTVFKKL